MSVRSLAKARSRWKWLARDERGPGAGAAQGLGQRQPEPAAATGDERRYIVKTHDYLLDTLMMAPAGRGIICLDNPLARRHPVGMQDHIATNLGNNIRQL